MASFPLLTAGFLLLWGLCSALAAVPAPVEGERGIPMLPHSTSWVGQQQKQAGRAPGEFHLSTLPCKTHILHASPCISVRISGHSSNVCSRNPLSLQQPFWLEGISGSQRGHPPASSRLTPPDLSFGSYNTLRTDISQPLGTPAPMLRHPQGDHLGLCNQSQTASSISDHGAHPPAIAVASLQALEGGSDLIPAKHFLLAAKRALRPQPLLPTPEPLAPDYPRDPPLNLLHFITTFPWFPQ